MSKGERFLFVIQARMGSERLPGKILMPIDNMNLLTFLVDRLKLGFPDTRIIVATSNACQNDIPYRGRISIHRHVSKLTHKTGSN